MEKKYKLVKTYPGQETLGKVIICKKGVIYSGKLLEKHILTKDVENNPEYWELLSNYEILSFITLGGGIRWKNVRDLFPSTNSLKIEDSRVNEFTESSLKKNPDYFIHSIRRKSDNIKFTIGDLITRGDYKTKVKIRGFNLLDDKLLVSMTDNIDKSYHEGRGCCLSIVKLVEKPLFITHDDVSKYIGDDYWVCDLKMNGHNVHKVYNASSTHLGKGINRTYFDSYNEATEYYNENVILFKTNDNLDVKLGDYFYYLNITTYDILKCKGATMNFRPHVSFKSYDLIQKHVYFNKPIASRRQIEEAYMKSNDTSCMQKLLLND